MKYFLISDFEMRIICFVLCDYGDNDDQIPTLRTNTKDLINVFPLDFTGYSLNS